MQTLDPGRRKDALDTLTPWSSQSHLLDALSEWYTRYLGRFPLIDTECHPAVIASWRLDVMQEVLARMTELMLEVRKLADEGRPSEVTPRIVELIDEFDVPFWMKES